MWFLWLDTDVCAADSNLVRCDRTLFAAMCFLFHVFPSIDSMDEIPFTSWIYKQPGRNSAWRRKLHDYLYTIFVCHCRKVWRRVGSVCVCLLGAGGYWRSCWLMCMIMHLLFFAPFAFAFHIWWFFTNQLLKINMFYHHIPSLRLWYALVKFDHSIFECST